MDLEAMKEQWGEAEDRDGIRLSWNVFPSSRMVCLVADNELLDHSNINIGSIPPCRPDRSSVHPIEGEARYATLAVRAYNLQTSLQGCAKPILVCTFQELSGASG